MRRKTTQREWLCRCNNALWSAEFESCECFRGAFYHTPQVASSSPYAQAGGRGERKGGDGIGRRCSLAHCTTQGLFSSVWRNDCGLNKCVVGAPETLKSIGQGTCQVELSVSLSLCLSVSPETLKNIGQGSGRLQSTRGTSRRPTAATRVGRTCDAPSPYGQREKERQRDSETVRQRDRETERQRDRNTERQRDRET